jgi:hypothetical protein
MNTFTEPRYSHQNEQLQVQEKLFPGRSRVKNYTAYVVEIDLYGTV